ncbi:MAG TPA: PIG-L family deacetylase [Verrucomicrobiae bacterium]|nr:PIG-L family deacetylase [Verrucomicrobiae bacterium]
MGLGVTDIASLGTILGVWAHPDDETFCMGGLMALAAANGQTVVCITATKGEAGSQDATRWPLDTLGGTRAIELTTALQILGAKHHHWLRHADGDCSHATDEAALAELMPLVEKYQPDTIITFPPDGLTGHEDHKAVCHWAGLIAAAAKKPPQVYYAVNTTDEASYLKELDDKFNFFFNLDQPVLHDKATCDMVLDLPPEIFDKKYRAFQVMPSQYENLLQSYPKDYLAHAFGRESYILASKFK